MIIRRDFIKKVGLGVAAFELSDRKDIVNATMAIDTQACTSVEDTSIKNTSDRWTFALNEHESLLFLQNAAVSISCKLAFVTENNAWKITHSRDGFVDRYALVDLQDNIQGYLVFISEGNHIQLLFYHRTAQAYKGVWSLEGKIHFMENSFACRTRPGKEERVLSLRCGPADSLLNDSLFAPVTDCLLQMDATLLNIRSLSGGQYNFFASGAIEESSHAVFSVRLEPHFFKRRYVPGYRPFNRERCPKTPTGWMS